MDADDIKIVNKEIRQQILLVDEWDEISDAQRSSIARGLKDMEEGNTISHKNMVKFYSKWLTK